MRDMVCKVGMIAILHTFNGKLAFDSHVHTMVTGGGLYEEKTRNGILSTLSGGGEVGSLGTKRSKLN